MGLLRAAFAAALLVPVSPAAAISGTVPQGAAAVPGLLAETVERFDHLKPGEAVAVSNLSLSAGHFTCTLRSGRAAPVRAGEETVGVFFEGDGAMEYVSADAIEASIVVFDTDEGTGMRPERTERGVVIRDSFRRLLWLAQGTPLPPITGPPAAPLADSFRKQREKFGRAHAAPLSHDFALQRLNDPSAPLVWAEIDGGKEDLVYELDRVDHPSEALLLLHPSESRDTELRKFLWPVALSFQPIGRDAREPAPPRFLLTDVEIDLTATAGNDVRIQAVETFVPVGSSIRALRLDLNDIWYAPSGAGLSTRAERVRGVKDGEGRALAFDHRNGEIVVALAAPAEADRPVRLFFDIEGDFLIRPGGDNYWGMGVSSWFPQPYLAEQAFTFRATVRVPKPFVPIASGTTVRRAAEGRDNVLETRVDRPIQFPVVVAGKFEFREEVREGVGIRVATYAQENPRAVKGLTNVAAEIIAFYRGFLGAFPFDEFDIIEINDYGYGQAPPGVMFITREAFDPLLGEMNQLTARGVARTFAHEIAHQYWGVAVRLPAYTEQWLSESFAEYCAALFLKLERGGAIYESLETQWRRGAKFATELSPIPFASRVYVANDPARRAEIRNGLLYAKGPLLLEALHRELGDAGFLDFLRSYQQSHAWKFGTTLSLAAELQALTKKDYMPFFDQFFWGTAMPAK